MKKTPKKSKHTRRRVTTVTIFEQFPPEIFFEIFEYLTGNHIFKSFFDLNGHFKELVYHAPNIHLDLLRTKTRFYRCFPRVFHLQNITSIVLSYENINLLETLLNSTDGIQLKSLSLLAAPLSVFDSRTAEVLSICKHRLISLKICFTDMHYNGSNVHAAQPFEYLLTEFPFLKHLVLEHPHGIDSVTYMPSSIINRTIVNLTIWLRDERRLIPLLYRFEKLKILTIYHSLVRLKMAVPANTVMSYRSQLREKTSMDYPIRVRHIKIYSAEILPERLERFFQILNSPSLSTLSLVTGKRPFQIHIMRWRPPSFLNSIQWHDLLKRYILPTMKKFHLEYADIDITTFIGGLVRVKKEFIKLNELPPSWKVLCSYDHSRKLLSIDVFPI